VLPKGGRRVDLQASLGGAPFPLGLRIRSTNHGQLVYLRNAGQKLVSGSLWDSDSNASCQPPLDSALEMLDL
jgi:hypothetical protein